MTPAEVRLSIVVATIGRVTLLDTLASIAPQAREGDETLVMFDAPMHGGWGHVAHNRGLAAAHGTHVIFVGDDDDFLPGAFDLVRQAVAEAPDTLHIFRVHTAENWTIPHTIPADPRNFSADLIPQGGIVVPRAPWLPRWEPVHSADRQFAAQAAENGKVIPIWHPEAIGRWRVHTWPHWVPRSAQPDFSKRDQLVLAGVVT